MAWTPLANMPNASKRASWHHSAWHSMTSLALDVDKLYAIRWSKPCEPTKYLQQDCWWLGPKWPIAISSLNINNSDWLDAKSMQTQNAVNTCIIQNLCGLEASEPLSMLAKPASSTEELKLAKLLATQLLFGCILLHCYDGQNGSIGFNWHATGHAEFLLWVSEFQTWDIWVVTASHHLPSVILPSSEITSKITKHQTKRQTRVCNGKKL